MRRCPERGWLIPEEVLDPLHPGDVLDRVSEVWRRGKGSRQTSLHVGDPIIDVLWDKLSEVDPRETEEARIDAHVYLSRYGRIDPGFWRDKDSNERRLYVKRLSELVKRESAESSHAETTS